MNREQPSFARSSVKAALLYFGLVFAAGFALGSIRVFWLVPSWGVRTAELLETPVMVLVTVLAAHWVVRKLKLLPVFSTRLCVGFLALFFLVVTEIGLGIALRGLSVSESITTRDPVSGSVYLVALMLFAVMPALVNPATLTIRSVAAERSERERSLPGDDLIPEALGSLTHAITIRQSRQEVWKWLVQMGAGRAGWYSYDFIDNGGKQSSDEIIPAFQNLANGALFPALPGVTDGFNVLRYEAGTSLVLGWVSKPNEPPIMTWAFVLEETNDGTTRLLVRARGGQNYRFHHLPMWLIKLGHFIMQRKQLHGIAWRAEQRTAPALFKMDDESKQAWDAA